MLTESEKQWLRSRELVSMAYCAWCRKCDLCYRHRFRGCPTDYTPGAEFEARVAAELAKYAARLSWNINCGDNCPGKKACTLSENRNIDCGDIFLKAAYLAVEKEETA